MFGELIVFAAAVTVTSDSFTAPSTALLPVTVTEAVCSLPEKICKPLSRASSVSSIWIGILLNVTFVSLVAPRPEYNQIEKEINIARTKINLLFCISLLRENLFFFNYETSPFSFLYFSRHHQDNLQVKTLQAYQ